jgi:hypothetical protein
MDEVKVEKENIIQKVFGRKKVDVDSAESSELIEDAEEHQAIQLAHTSLSFGDLVYAFIFKKKLSITGDWIYRDIKVFIPEVIGYGIAVFLAVICFIGIELVNFFWLMDFQKRASEMAFNEVSQHMGMATQTHAIALVILIAIIGLFFVFKTFVLMPNKHKVPVLRAFRGGLLRMSVDSFRNNEMKFWGNPVGDRINVQEPREHVDWNTGLPFLVLVEGKGLNKSIVKDEKIDLTSIEWDSVLSSAISTQASIDEWKFSKKNAGLGFNPMLIVIGVVILLILAGAFLYLQQPQAVAATTETAKAMALPLTGGVMF